VMFLGLDQSVEAEMRDRINITLPGVQEQFAALINGLNKPTVVVLINGGTVALSSSLIQSTDSILEAWYPGYYGARAIADALFGDYNPGGKLPVTIYDADYVNQVDMKSMSMTTAPGRSYRYFTGQPLWPFGFGLSYTNFSFSYGDCNPSSFIDPSAVIEMSNVDGPEFSIPFCINVTNVGSQDGDEVAQVYFSPQETEVADPLLKQLIGFQRVHLEAGASTILTFNISAGQLLLTDEQGNRLSAPGTYNLWFTNGVDQRLDALVKVRGEITIVKPFPGSK